MVRKCKILADTGDVWLSKQEYGQVPQYLLKRKLAMAAAYAQEMVRRDGVCTHPG